MNALVRKEIRLLLPSFGIGLLLTFCLWLLPHNAGYASTRTFLFEVTAFFLCPAMAMVTALASFGQEISSGTFANLLSQPVSRSRLWWTKIALLAAALAILFIAWAPSVMLQTSPGSAREMLRDTTLATVLFVPAVLSGGLWTVLLFRQLAAAFWITLLVPAALLMTVASLLDEKSDMFESVLIAVFVVYAVGGFLWAWRLFLRAQDAQWTGGNVSMPGFRWWTAGCTPSAGVPPQRPLRALLRKEFQLHSISLFCAAGVLVLHLAAIALRKNGSDLEASHLRDVANMAWVFWFALPFIAGATAVAGERQLGTMEGQLCLPVRKRTQFIVKLAFALAVGALLGGVMPWLLENLAQLLGAGSDFLDDPAPQKIRGTSYVLFVLTQPSLLALTGAALALISFYSSTLSRTTLQAMGAALGLGAAIAFLVGAAVGQADDYIDAYRLFGTRMLVFVGLPAMVLVFVRMAFANYQRLYTSGKLWLRNAVVLALSTAFIGTAMALTYHRVWELAIPLEPPHGPARLSGPIHPRICSVGVRIFVLLPDARLWATKNFRWQELDEDETYRDKDGKDLTRKVQIPLSVDGEFLGNSNWMSLAATWQRVWGVQSDGSLWSIFTRNWTNDYYDSSMPKLERIGTGSDWVSVAAGNSHFLVLKNDGSLWGWGGNHSGQLGPGPEQFTNELARVGQDADWVSVFASRSGSIGIKRDGSVWKWGFLQTSPNGDEKKWANEHPEPVRWTWEGTNWISIVDNYGSDLAVRSDGSLWTAGYLRANLLGKSLGTRFPFERRFDAKPLQVTPAAAIADISTGGSFLIALTGSGSLLENFQYSLAPFWARATWKVSRHSDWLAIDGSYRSGEIRALASDGTLSRWRPAYCNRDISEDFLNSSRKPLASINILDSVK